jgi:uncharacterized protein
METINKILSVPGLIVIYLIKFYRFFISPILGSHCRFSPTCSSYAIQALTKYGFFYGFYLSLKRILKCHPWHPGGIDNIP